MSRARKLLIATVALAALLALALVPRPLTYAPASRTPIADADAWAAGKVAESRALGVRPGDEERLARYAPGSTPVSILYLHGFGAARPEGEAVVDRVAARVGANTLYGRLPGHGLDDMDAHAGPAFGDYLDTVEEAFQAAKLLGDRVLLMGTSTGGLLATWLAARHPDDVAGLVVASPLYAFGDPTARLLDAPVGPLLVYALYGEVRDAGWKTDPEQRKQPGYERHWTIQQRYAAAFHLGRLRRYVARPETFEAVSAPVLLFRYYQDESTHDATADVDAMRRAFETFGGASGRHPASRLVDIADGAHVLFSEYVRSDKERIVREIDGFLGDIGVASRIR